MDDTTYNSRVAALGVSRDIQIAGEENASQTMIERHGREPGSASDVLWGEWNDIAYRSIVALSEANL